MKSLALRCALIALFSVASFWADGKNAQDAETFLKGFLNPKANHVAMTQKLIPQSNDCQMYFTDKKLAQLSCKTYAGMLADFGIQPKAGQTELLVWQATGAELAAGTGNAYYFPGGYKNIAAKINPNAVIFAFKFVKPGKKIGYAFDGLTYVNGQWRIFPKPWRLK